MPVAYQDKPIDLLREEAIDQLIMNYGHGQISLEAFERRLDRAYESQDHQTLAELTADLTLDIDKAYIEKKKQEMGVHYDTEPPEDIDYVVNIFGGSNRSGAWSVPREMVVFSIFGGGEIDFSEARFSPAGVKVKIYCIFGGISIVVPKEVNTRCKAICIFGGIDNRGSSEASAGAPTVSVEGLVLFGGAEIKVKRLLREQVRQFADEMKTLFGFSGGQY